MDGKLFKTIELTDEECEIIKPLIDISDDADVAYRKASRWLKESNKKLWDIIGEIISLEDYDKELTAHLYHKKKKVFLYFSNDIN